MHPFAVNVAARYLLWAWCGLLVGMGGSAPAARANEVRLHASMSGRVYHYREPVLMDVWVRNAGRTTFRDMAPLYPGYGHLRLRVSRDGERLPMTGGRITIAYRDEGLTVPPGAEVSEVVELADWFGENQAIGVAPGPGINPRQLRPGAYSVEIQFVSRTGYRKRHAQEVLDGPTLEFRVLAEVESTPMTASERALVLDMQAGRTPFAGRGGITDLMVYAKSRYLFVAWQHMGLGERDAPLASLLADLEAAGANGIVMAAIARWRCWTYRSEKQKKLEWLGALEPASRSEHVRRVVRSFQLMTEQERYIPVRELRGEQ